MARQLCCRGMCKNLLRYDGQQRNFGKAKFPSNLNYGKKKTLVKRAPGLNLTAVSLKSPFRLCNSVQLHPTHRITNVITYALNLRLTTSTYAESAFSVIHRNDRISTHGDVIKWKHFPRYWPFARRIPRSPVNSPHKGQRRKALIRLSKQSWGWWFETPSRSL